MTDHAVVLGGGLAGVACSKRLGDEGVDVTLVDRNDYHQFQPLLYQVASSQLPVEDIARPHRTIFRDSPSVSVETATVTEAKLSERTLVLSDGRTVTGSHLVIATRARPNPFLACRVRPSTRSPCTRCPTRSGSGCICRICCNGR